MLDSFLSSPSLAAFCSQWRGNSSVLVEHLWDPPKALLAHLAQKCSGKHLLFISTGKQDGLLQSLSFFTKREVLDIPAWETLPGENIAPSSDITGKRLYSLYQILHAKEPVTIHVSLPCLLQKTLSPTTLSSSCLSIQTGQEYPFSDLIARLQALGYTKSPIAADKGEFAVRGGIVDVFPAASLDPYRIDFFGNTIESIRTYDPISQKSVCNVDSLFLCPASEYAALLAEKHLSTLLDYLGPNTLIVLSDMLSIEDAYVSLQSLPGMQGRLLFPFQEFLAKLSTFSTLFFADRAIEELSPVQIPSKKGRAYYSGKDPFQPISFEFFGMAYTAQKYHHPFLSISQFFSRFENQSASTKEEILLGLQERGQSMDLELHLITSSEAELRSIQKTAEELHVTFPKKTYFDTGYLPSGFVLADGPLAYLPGAELTHRYKVLRQPWRHSYHSVASDFHQLLPGDIIVHIHHGIGKFSGIEIQKNHLGQEAEFFVIEYANHGKLSVPITQSHLISRYIGSQESPPSFSVLGTKRWQKTYVDTQKAILGYAKDLLDSAAKRASHPGTAFPKDTHYMELFEEEFPYPETEDQLKAIADVKQDMIEPKPMDRLICGDVGYGKTEVAMRAAFKAAFEGKKQVAVLVPTTLLAKQHYENFCTRMQNFPLHVAKLSRFCSAKEIKKTLQDIAEGKVDIVIGTHRLINKDVVFKDLGLLIIDEEQRFGVRAKEAIKSRKEGVDCLTLSATPIPRTLYMSLLGIRQISTINTPPQDRLPIKSILCEKDPMAIQHALLREFARNGQAFFIHNRVETLPRVYQELQKLVPQAKIVMGHGQMDPEEIETVFSAFTSGEADILLSTTIIENGIDIPSANTIFIDRSDQFGMADLYQLRGRVGRGGKIAFAYFLTPKQGSMSELAYKRLKTLAESSGYGSGMKIALRDLELRGAGNILGTEQSGEISAVGFHLYCKMLKKAIHATASHKPLDLTETKMELLPEAKLPETYIEESVLRMEFYYRLGSAVSLPEIEEIEKELKDRFGALPKEAQLLCVFTKIKIQASSLHIISLKFTKQTLYVEKQTAKETFRIPSPFPRVDAFEKEIIQIITNWNANRKTNKLNR